MKTAVWWMVVVGLAVWWMATGVGAATYEDACDLGEHPAARLAGKGLCAVAGAAVGFGVHEGAHWVVGGGEVSFSGTSWRCPGCSVGKGQTVAMAGFGAQQLANEILLVTPGVPREHPAIVGFLLFNILHPVLYAAGAVEPDPSDFGNFHNPVQERWARGIVLGVAAVQVAQVLLDVRIPLQVKATGRDITAMFTMEW